MAGKKEQTDRMDYAGHQDMEMRRGEGRWSGARRWWLICGLLLGIGTAVRAQVGRPYVEHRTGRNVVRIDAGPGEASSIGSYAIRVFDPPGLRLWAGLVRERHGALIQAWVEADETSLEIWVWTQTAGSGAYGTLERYRFENRELRPAPIPDPADALLDGYMGHDRYEFADGVIVRTFPVYLPDDSNAEPTGGERCLVFDPQAETWRVSDPGRAVEDDS